MGSKNENHRSICEVLAGLPPKYPVSEFVADGVTESVEFFIVLDPRTRLAYFSGVGGSLVIVECKKISLIEIPGA